MGLQDRLCSRCVMDTSAADITFDAEGHCSYCTRFLQTCEHVLRPNEAERSRKLRELVSGVKRNGRGRKYDCVVGVSGGVDSSWVLVKAVELGLRPLAVHMDNGWNSELAQNNIANLVRGLGIDLFTHVIDWTEYRSLMQAFFDADVIDLELLYDNAMLAVNYRQAARAGLRNILSGTNRATEGLEIPSTWTWNKFDRRNILALAQRGGVSLRTFPSIGTFGAAWYLLARRTKWVWFLDYLPYRKADAIEVLQRDFGYKPYPYKHYESIFTRFYQGYILPRKFGIDKRRVHLSTLVISGELTRAEAVALMQSIPYPCQEDLETDIAYFLKKMNWTRAQLDDYLARPPQPHDRYGSEAATFRTCLALFNRCRGRKPSAS
jgi:N-acetyl sugar amidotransferase